MSSDPKRVQKAALDWIKKNGPMDKVSAARMAQSIQSGNVELRNDLTIDDAHQIGQLIMAISYTASPDRYENGTGIPDPNAGAQLLASPALKTAPVMQAIAEIAGAGSEYAQAVNVALDAQNKSEAMQRSSEQIAEDVQSINNTGLELPEVTQQHMHQPNTQQTESGGVLHATATEGGYARVSETAFKQERKIQAQGTVTMAEDGSGGTYRGSLTGTGDSRQMRAAMKEHNARNTSSQSGD